jgi:hypothetical protein
VLAAFTAQGLSRRAMVAQLNSLGIRAASGGVWSLTQLQRVLNAQSAGRNLAN